MDDQIDTSHAPSRPLAVVTGGARGIGKALVERFAQGGYEVLYSYKNQPAADLSHAKGIRADCATREGVRDLAQEAMKAARPLCCLINNVGLARFELLGQTPVETLDHLFHTNVSSALLCYQEMAPHLQEGGSLINLLSIAGLRPKRGSGIYGATKAALTSLTTAMSDELRDRAISVYGVMPGLVLTEAMAAPAYERIREQASKETPLGRLCEPEVIANICFELHKKRHSLHFPVITVTGGQHLY